MLADTGAILGGAVLQLVKPSRRAPSPSRIAAQRCKALLRLTCSLHQVFNYSFATADVLGHDTLPKHNSPS